MSLASGQVPLFVLVLAHAIGKFASIPILFKTSPVALAASVPRRQHGGVPDLQVRARRPAGPPVLGPHSGHRLQVVADRANLRQALDGLARNAPVQASSRLGRGVLAQLFTLFETQAACIGSCVAYWYFYDGADSSDKLDDVPLFTSLAVLVGSWFGALGTLLRSIERAYLHTFVSTETAPRFLRRWFVHLAGNDEPRMVIFQNNPASSALWRAFAEEVADWVAEHYHEMVGQPWFTPATVETIPDSMLPTVDLGATPQPIPPAIPASAVAI
jgi:hypothetical protein